MPGHVGLYTWQVVPSGHTGKLQQDGTQGGFYHLRGSDVIVSDAFDWLGTNRQPSLKADQGGPV